MTSAESKPIRWLAAAHFANDFFSGTVGIMLAAQDDVIGLNEQQIGLASGLFLGISITQPFIGWLSDRLSVPHLMILGSAVTAVGLALMGFAPSFAYILLGALLGGFGNAMFHPSGLAGARAFGGEERKGSTVAVFMVAGNGAFAISPFIVGFSLEAFGPGGILPFTLLNLALMPLIFMRVQRPLRNILEHAEAPSAKAKTPPSNDEQVTDSSSRQQLNHLPWYRAAWVLIAAYMLIILLRSVVYQALNTFLPTFYKDQGLDLGFAGSATSLLFVFAAVGGFMAARMSDRLPRLQIIAVSLISIAPLTWLLLFADGIFIFIVSVPLGLALGANWPVILIIGQEVLPGGASGSSGLVFGWAFVANGMGTIVAGIIADAIGLQDTLLYAALLPILGAFLVFLLPAQSPTMAAITSETRPASPVEAGSTP